VTTKDLMNNKEEVIKVEVLEVAEDHKAVLVVRLLYHAMEAVVLVEEIKVVLVDTREDNLANVAIVEIDIQDPV